MDNNEAPSVSTATGPPNVEDPLAEGVRELALVGPILNPIDGDPDEIGRVLLDAFAVVDNEDEGVEDCGEDVGELEGDEAGSLDGEDVPPPVVAPPPVSPVD